MSIDEFKEEVYNLATVNGRSIKKLTDLAEQLKDEAVFLVEIIIKSIKESIPNTKLPKFYLLDSITKAVGGKYIEMFAQHIKSVYPVTFKQSPNSVKKKLLTLFKTWYIYYPHEILNTIYNELELSRFERELLTPEDHKKIQGFISSKTREENKARPAVRQANPLPPPMSRNNPRLDPGYIKRERGMKRMAAIPPGGRFPMKQPKKQFTYQNPPGFFPYVMKAFEFYNPSLNQIVMGGHREERISKAVNQLYSPSTYMCTICGMRFMHHSALKDHLDYHFQQNVSATERRSGPHSRKAFSTYQNWVTDSSIDIINKNKEEMTREQQELENCIPFSTSEGQCFICGEEFKSILKDDDEWYFINCKKAKINKLLVKVHVTPCSKMLEDECSKLGDNGK